MAEERVQRRLAAILASDVVGYSRMMREDETGTLKRLQALRRELLDPKVEEYGGRVVNTAGDGTIVEFPSAVDAVQHAIDVQQEIVRRNSSVPEVQRIEIRIGIHLGDVIVEGNDIFGDGVNIASRLEGIAEPGATAVSLLVRESVRHKLAVEFDDLGEKSVKNIADPVHVFQVRREKSEQQSDTMSDALFRRPAVAVMPFENMSGDPEQEFFADGLTEDLITALSQWRSFPVIARNSTFAYKGQSPDIRKVGEELGARYVIEGSVRKSGDRVRVTAQLINTDTGHHVWAERYDRALEDFFDLQDEITQHISAVIAPELDRAEEQRTVGKRPENLDAWERYQRGMSLFQTIKSDEVSEAQKLFEQAMELDPTFARAYVGYVCTYHQKTRMGFEKTDREKAMRVARRAVELDNEDALTHFALGLFYYSDRNPEPAISAFEYAIQLNPSFAPTYALLGNALSASGRAEEAIPQIEKAIRLNPHDPAIGPVYTRLARAYLFLKKHEDAVKWARQSIRNQAFNWPSLCYLASALAHLDRLDEARLALDEMNEVFSGVTIDFVREHTPVIDTSYMDHYLAGLSKAGLPE